MARHAARIGPHWQAVSADWRAKQIEYTWVRSLAGPAHHRDFWRLTEEALAWAAARHGITDAALLADVLLAYRRLDAYPEVPDVLRALGAHAASRRAILSNGEPGMLGDAVRAAGIDTAARRRAQRRDGRRVQAGSAGLSPRRGPLRRLTPARMAFVSSNPWDAFGAGELRLPGVLGQPRPTRRPNTTCAPLATELTDLAALPDLLA